LGEALAWIEELSTQLPMEPTDPARIPLEEVRSRLAYLVEVGLGYLTLDRPTRTLSGGETERVNLTTCLGTRLVNTLFVLDEPSVGLHPRDTDRLVGLLHKLRDAGNTVVVVEHEGAVIRAADHVVDLGPGHGESGGEVVFQGTVADLLRCPDSMTGAYLSGRRRVSIPERRPVLADRPDPGCFTAEALVLADQCSVWRGSGPVTAGTIGPGKNPRATWRVPVLRLSGITRHNLRDLAVEIPLQRLVCVTGVSGSGKTTLIREVLLPALERQFQAQSNPSAVAGSDVSADPMVSGDEDRPEAEDGLSGPTALSGAEALIGAVLVDQSSVGRTPRSNPAVYTGAFDDIREVFAQAPDARRSGLNAGAFSFNSPQGQCQRCRGAGFEKIEMQFLSDIFVRCPECDGRRYRPHILEVKVASARAMSKTKMTGTDPVAEATVCWNVADLLDATVDEGVRFLDACPDSLPARRAVARLRLLQEVGLGYLRLGQPVNTLSGGESQRLKLVSHLASANLERRPGDTPGQALDRGLMLLFDEPTTGLHFDDVRVLLGVFQRLVDAGHSVVVIEHNLDVVRSADWVIDLGPEAGAGGGRVVVAGTPEDVLACPASHTGQALRLADGKRVTRSAPRSETRRAPPRQGVRKLRSSLAVRAKGRGSTA
jgi:excinuclease ABC subunit A